MCVKLCATNFDMSTMFSDIQHSRMTEEFFYYYTTIETAKVILLSAEILPSLAVCSEGFDSDGLFHLVYLKTCFLNCELTR